MWHNMKRTNLWQFRAIPVFAKIIVSNLSAYKRLSQINFNCFDETNLERRVAAINQPIKSLPRQSYRILMSSKCLRGKTEKRFSEGEKYSRSTWDLFGEIYCLIIPTLSPSQTDFIFINIFHKFRSFPLAACLNIHCAILQYWPLDDLHTSFILFTISLLYMLKIDFLSLEATWRFFFRLLKLACLCDKI